MRRGDLVQYKPFRDNGKNLDNIGVILDMETDLIIPSRYSGALYEKVDLLLIRWLNGESDNVIPYYKQVFDGRKWYLKEHFYLVF